MKCPICNRRPKVFPSVQIKGVVKEWCARCEGTRHVVSVWSPTREGLDIAWAPHNEALHHDDQYRCGMCGKVTAYNIGICDDCAN